MSALYGIIAFEDHFPDGNSFDRRLTGQDIATVGVMGALSGAVTTASAMLRRNVFGDISRAARNASRPKDAS